MTTISFNDSNKFKAASPVPIGAAVVFLGSQYNFSASLIAATNQELGDVCSVVLGSVSDLYVLIETGSRAPGVVVVDEQTLIGLDDIDRAKLLAAPVGSMGVAFSSVGFGITCYEREDLRKISASIFPLNVRLDVWLSIIRMLAHGGSYVSPDVTAARRARPAEPELSLSGLTQRQLDVLRLVADGYSNKRIANKLGLSVHTVKLHLHNANLRLGVSNRTEAAMRYRAMKK
ncbi:response regulator transcription factor [Paracoccus aerodenitrificans]|uniref:response regulator transcription factor n=1 Tax=Paracoccus aerodenitrificans TaxID=3017781 RepID=UPI0022EFE0F4|nr:response regulator transcription factor [Paracoccus aerodenitrificans]WBU64448.1 response regulator transcription factor [Paracoccus aerodenitrificans]